MTIRLTRRLSLLVAVAAVGLLTTATAQAAITTAPATAAGATAIATAIATNPAHVLGGIFVAHPGDGPNGTANAPINVFPTNGSTFGILTSGNVQFADDPNSAGNTGQDDGGGNVRGNTDFDVTILRIDVNAPLGSNCLTFDFKFLSDEYPEYVGTAYNDAFIAELDSSTWTTVGSAINAPNNFAFDPLGNVISINAAGVTSMTAGHAAGTTYDGATPLLSASTQVTPGAHALYLSIFDQGDHVWDSAVFLDNLRIGFVPNPAVNCRPGAQPVNFQLTLQPPSAENLRGQSHTVTATLTDENGAPVSGQTIQFEVTGANTASGTNVTDSNGQATFTYPGAFTGDDTITACYNADASPDGSCEAIASATKRWVIGPPASLTLTPPDATNTAGEEHCLTATVEDEAGNPVPDVVVNFTVSGANTATGADTTGASGDAQFCYTGTHAGLDTITATVAGTLVSGTATKTYVPAAPAHVTVTPPTSTNPAGQEHCVTAHVTDSFGNPVPGTTVNFSVSGANTATGVGTTVATGDAQFCYTGTHAGFDTITATVAGTTVSGTATKTYVPAAPATLTLTPKTAVNTVGAQHCVTATVVDSFGNPTPGITVHFSVTGSVIRSGTGTSPTDANGQATFCYTGPALPGSDVITAYVDTNNNGVQDPGEPSDTATKNWVLPQSTPGCKITDGGRITADNGDKATFGSVAKVDAAGNPSGAQEYQDHGAAADLNVHSTAVLAVLCSGNKASVFGTATINGAGSFDYRIDLTDNNEPGTGFDTYRIRLSTGYDSGEQTLAGGNIQMH